MAKKKILDNERIIHLYVDQEKTLVEVSKIVGCSKGTILNRLSAAGVATRTGGQKPFAEIYRDLYDVRGIINAYSKQQKPLETVGKEFGISGPTVLRILKQEGIPTRSISEGLRLKYRQRSEITVSLEAGLGDRTVNVDASIQEMREAGLRIDQIAEIKGLSAREVYEVIYG